MKKKTLVLLATSALTLSAAAVAAVTISTGFKDPDRIKATSDYSLTITDPIYEGSDAEGSGVANKIIKTTLGNDVKLEYNKLYEYEEGYYHTHATGINCMKNGSYIAIVANSEGNGVSGITSISITTDNDTRGSEHYLCVYYGWNDGNYILSEKYSTGDGDNTYEFTLGDNRPTFAKIAVESDNADNRVGVHSITIEYTCVTSSNPYHFEGDFGYLMYEDKAVLAVYTGTNVDIVIPASVNGKPVKSIADDFAVSNILKSNIETVTLPSCLDTIGANAFKGASKLESINLDNVEYIGDYAFYYCSSLVEVDLSSAQDVGDYSFTNCTALEDIGSFDSIISIGSHAFYSTNTLDDDLAFPSTLTSVGESAFMHSAIKSLTIDDAAVASLGNASFRNCSYLRSVYIGNNVYRCDDFTYDDVLESLVVGDENDDYCTIDNVLYYMESSTSWVGVRLAANRPQTTYVMPEKVSSLFSYFAYQSNTLTSVTFNDKITQTHDYTFSYSTNLSSITFGANLTLINDSFVGCTSLTSLHIPGTVRHIAQRAFNGCTELKTVIIDEGVTRLDREAFAYCTSLDTVVIPTTLTSAGQYYGWSSSPVDVFNGCAALTNVFTRLTSGGYSTSAEGPIFDGFYGTRTLNNYSETSAAGCWHFDGSGNPVLW